MTQLLMPKATAVWLIDNTGLTFEQIGAFCDLHPLEVQAIADGEIGAGMQGYDPITNNQLSKEELARCEAAPEAGLELSKSNLPQPTARTKGPRMCQLPDVVTSLMQLLGWSNITLNYLMPKSAA